MRWLPLLALLVLTSCDAPGLLVSPQAPPPSATDPIPQPLNGWWRARHERLLDRARPGTARLVFLGDSITQRWENTGAASWIEYYAHRKGLNLGAEGDRTQHILWRIDHGALDSIRPEVVVVLAGTNNLDSDPPEEVARGIRAIVARLRDRLPRAKVLLLGLFPRGSPADPLRHKVAAVNTLIRGLDDGRMVRYLDQTPAFLGPAGEISPEVMPDALHPSPLGYRLWARAMEPALRELLKPE